MQTRVGSHASAPLTNWWGPRIHYLRDRRMAWCVASCMDGAPSSISCKHARGEKNPWALKAGGSSLKPEAMAGRPPACIGYRIRNHPRPSHSMHIRDNQPRPARHCPLRGFISRCRVSLPPRESALAADESCPQRLSQGCLRPLIDESHFGPTWMRLQCKQQEKPVVRYPRCLAAEGRLLRDQ